ncbi:MAG TPA: TlpA disulfide reductase family protein [Anaerolineales bacterium]|nr:TlpA disulfide reductase family protein [Anaerolineales bacterium]
MAEKQENAFQHAEQLLRAGRKLEARSLLFEYVRQNPASAHGWWLLSLAVTDEGQQVDCLERVVKLDPQHGPACTRLEKLKEKLASRPSAPNPLKQETAAVNISAETHPAATASKQLHSIRPASRRGGPTARTDWILLIASFLILMCFVAGGFGFVVVTQLRQPTAPRFDAQPTEDLAAYAPQTLPPTWTATITHTPPPSATFIPAEDTGYSTPNQLFKLTGPSTGLFAPDFTLKDVVSGNQVRMSNYSGGPVLLFFWATWCPHCANEMPSMQSVYGEYRGRGLVVLALDVGESAAKARGYRSAHGLTFTVLNDSSQTVATEYRVTGFPTHFFVTSRGQITSIVVGEINHAGLVSKVQSLLTPAP